MMCSKPIALMVCIANQTESIFITLSYIIIMIINKVNKPMKPFSVASFLTFSRMSKLQQPTSSLVGKTIVRYTKLRDDLCTH